ncbi:LAQU0S02e01838g1_1 [Lachancea quebecensis]|uniref:LAQU0S02e01838g1_1 n=1 Tax=Lachancea quebecensis TaxID=1654605 RepID=A0A0P1KP06_9SACH|nr:LAQU0S02e01838g1_1 [Lachancea quebecensis]
MSGAHNVLKWSFKELLSEVPSTRFRAMISERMPLKLEQVHTGAPVLSPGDHLLYFNPQRETLDIDGYFKYQTPAALLHLPLPFKRRMWALGAMSFKSPLRIDHSYECVETIKFVKKIRQDYYVGINRQIFERGSKASSLDELRTLVYTNSAPAPLNPAVAHMQNPAATVRLTFDETDVFRYSSLTFNPHRVHWDHKYCTEVEGYPNTIVQGPFIVHALLKYVQCLGLRVGSIKYKNSLYLNSGSTVELCVTAPVEGKCEAHVRDPQAPNIIFCKAALTLA